jgi:hypothetical protein
MSFFLASVLHLQQVTVSGCLHKLLAARVIPPSVYKLQVGLVTIFVPYFQCSWTPTQWHAPVYNRKFPLIQLHGLACYYSWSWSSLSSLSSRITRSNKWLNYDRDSIPGRCWISSRYHHKTRLLYASYVEFDLQIQYKIFCRHWPCNSSTIPVTGRGVL